MISVADLSQPCVVKKIKVANLKEELRKFGLAQNGLKSELVTRLKFHLEAESNTSVPTGEKSKENSHGKRGRFELEDNSEFHRACSSCYLFDWGKLTKYIFSDPAFPFDSDLTIPDKNLFVSQLIHELSRFLVLKALTRDVSATLLSPSFLVDKAWHAFLLFPKDYAKLCDTILPADVSDRLIDHDPFGASDKKSRNDRYSLTLTKYEDLFTAKPPPKFWEDIAEPASPQVAGSNTQQVKEARFLTICLKDQTGEVTFFKVKSTTKMELVFNTYAARKGVRASALRFLLVGERVNPDHTPDSLQLQNEDQINVLLEQQGC